MGTDTTDQELTVGPKRVAVVGTGSRGLMFVNGILERPHLAIVVALCDPNAVRAGYYVKILQQLGTGSNYKVHVYHPDSFKEMLSGEKIDILVVTTYDSLHDAYIVQALEAGVRVITEKPMTTDIEKCRRINLAVKKAGDHQLTVTFNYRYNPVHEAVKRLIADGEIGNVISVHFEWLLDTVHGADYFRRWHRLTSHSGPGGLLVHKSGHHFDLVNWWLAADPVEVAAMGKLSFYGEEAGMRNGWAKDYVRARGSVNALEDPFALNIESDDLLKSLYADAEELDGYFRDRNVFASDVGINDDMGLLVRYSTGTMMTYHLTTYSPWEGYRVMFNGSKARLELEVVETAFREPTDPKITGGVIHGKDAPANAGGAKIIVHPLWSRPREVPVAYTHAGHGGGDSRMLSVLFGPKRGEIGDGGDAVKQRAGVRDGTMALAVGLAAAESIRTGSFVKVDDLALEG